MSSPTKVSRPSEHGDSSMSKFEGFNGISNDFNNDIPAPLPMFSSNESKMSSRQVIATNSVPNGGLERDRKPEGKMYDEALRRPGTGRQNPIQQPGKTYFCHECKLDLPEVTVDFCCPYCLGEFIEESDTVERATQSENAGSNGKADDVKNKDDNHVSNIGEDILGFAWIPPSSLTQAFLKKEDKLVGFETPNPYLYLDDEDVVEVNFPCLNEPEPLAIDENIVNRLKSRPLTSKAKIPSEVKGSALSDLDDVSDDWQDDEEEDKEKPSKALQKRK